MISDIIKPCLTILLLLLAVSGCAKKSCPGEGFLGKDCKCWCPGSPVQYCDGSGDVHPVHVNGSAVDDKADSDEFLEVDSEGSHLFTAYQMLVMFYLLHTKCL